MYFSALICIFKKYGIKFYLPWLMSFLMLLQYCLLGKSLDHFTLSSRSWLFMEPSVNTSCLQWQMWALTREWASWQLTRVEKVPFCSDLFRTLWRILWRFLCREQLHKSTSWKEQPFTLNLLWTSHLFSKKHFLYIAWIKFPVHSWEAWVKRLLSSRKISL